MTNFKDLSGKFAIVGVAESDEMGTVPNKSALQLHAEAARNAIADAGLTKNDVDAVFSAGRMFSTETAEYLGIRPRYIDGTSVGGCSFIQHCQHAMAAINAGLCEVALITHGESGRSRLAMPTTNSPKDSLLWQFEVPYGIVFPFTAYGFIATRHMHEYGTTQEQLAEVAVATRAWARLNPKANQRGELSVADVMKSPIIAWPFHVLDCCLVTDAGGAAVITSAERAKNLKKNPVYILGTGEGTGHCWVNQMPDFHRRDWCTDFWSASLCDGWCHPQRYRCSDALRRIHDCANTRTRRLGLLQERRRWCIRLRATHRARR